MNKISTIGFTQKTAEEFFKLLVDNKVDWVIDIRLKPNTQISGFAKGNNLPYFLNEIARIEYRHVEELAPTKEILENYRKKQISWEEYEKQFLNLLKYRKIEERIQSLFPTEAQNPCLLCSEAGAAKCHRRLVSEYLQSHLENLNIIHLK